MTFDKDLQAIQQARDLAKAANQAQKVLSQMSQQQLDTVVRAVAKAFAQAAPELAEMAVRETGFGNVEDKIIKNEFASLKVFNGIIYVCRGSSVARLIYISTAR